MPKHKVLSVYHRFPLVNTFPLDALPQVVRAFTVQCASSLPVAPETVGVPALVVIGGAIGNARRIRLKDGWTEPTSLWAAVVARSGYKKSPAVSQAAEPLLKRDSLQWRTWTADITGERLASLLEEHPRGLFSYRDELSAWVKSMNQYRAGKGSDRQFFLSLYSGTRAKVDRQGGEKPISRTLTNPCWSVIGGIQPDVLRDLEDDDGREDGFLPRLLFTCPRPVSVKWTDITVSTEIRLKYDSLIQSLLDLPYVGDPVYLDLCPEAKEYWIDWHDAHCAEVEDESLSPFQQATYSKLLGACGRIALIHAVATDPRTSSVGLASIQAAIKLISYFKGQFLKIEPLISCKPSKLEGCKDEIRRKVSVSRLRKRELQRNSAYPAEIFNAAFKELLSPEIEIDSDDIVSLSPLKN